MNGIGENLKRIRLLKSLSLKEAGKLLNMSATAIQKYENGDIIPNSEKIIEFANAYNIKAIEILKYYDKPTLKFTSFRKKKRLVGQKLDLLKELISNKISDYLNVIELNNIENDFIKIKKFKCNSLEDAENISYIFRNNIDYSLKQPLSDLINILENLGVLIVFINNENNKFDDFDGLTEIVNNIPIIVLLEDKIDGARQRFTLAHELGHLLLDVNSNLDEDKICDRFASALLMPKEAVINEFGNYRKRISFFELKAFMEEYKVSYNAIIYRLKDLNIISDYTYRELYINLNKLKLNKKDILKPERSFQYEKLVHKLEINEIISLNRACELLGVTLNEYYNENNNN